MARCRSTLHGLPVGFALAGAKADERAVLVGILDDPTVTAGRTRQTIIADRHYYGRAFATALAEHGIALLRPARAGGNPVPRARRFKPLRQVIESINDTLKGQLDLGQHGGTPRSGSWSVCCSASCRWPRRSGTTATSAPRPHDH